MKYMKGKEGYAVRSFNNPNKYYKVSLDLKSCNCPAFKYFTKGQPCKHIIFLMNEIEPTENIKKVNLDAINGVDASVFVDKFGEETLDYLKRNGEIYEKYGKIYRLK